MTELKTTQAELRTKKITSRSVDGGTKFTIHNDSICVEGNSGKEISFTQGMIKGYNTVYDQGDGSEKRTLNLSTTTDVGPGHLHYNHINNYIATSGYVQMPNDPSSATKGFIQVAVGGSEAPTSALAQSNLYDTNYSLADGKHAVAFGGELA